MSDMNALIRFVESERKNSPSTEHVAEWALHEIQRLWTQLADAHRALNIATGAPLGVDFSINYLRGYLSDEEARRHLEKLVSWAAQAQSRYELLRDLLAPAVADAEWRDKRIHPCEGEVYQNWLLQVYLPVPESAADKSVEAALARAIGEKK